jgi:hypothetical protein
VNNPKTFPSTTKSLVEFTRSANGEIPMAGGLQAKDGKIVQNQLADKVDFMVQYQGFWFAIHLDQQGTRSYLHIHGNIGKLPYSYESSFARTNVLAVVRAAGKTLGGNVRVDGNQNIILIDTVTCRGNMSPKILLAETAKVFLRIKPYLQLVQTLQPPKNLTIRAPENYIEQSVTQTPEQAKTNSTTLKTKPTILLKPN